MTTNTELNMITSAVYEQLFGMTRDDMLQQAKQAEGDNWDAMRWHDDDEALRDCLSLEAITALRVVEGKLFKELANDDLPKTLNQVIEMTKGIANEYGSVSVVWYDESEDV